MDPPCGCRVHYDADCEVNLMPKLSDAAFAVARRHLWDLTKLPQIISEYAYKEQCQNLTKHHIFNAAKKTESELHKIEKLLIHFTFIPYSMKVKILASVAGLNEDVKEFALKVSLEKPLKKTFAYCIKCIVFTNSGAIDFNKSILNIMKKSLFKVHFTKNFLEHHCITYSDFSEVYEAVLKVELIRITMMKRKKSQNLLNNHLQNNLKMVRYYMDNMIDPSDYWHRGYATASDEHYIPDYASQLQSVVIPGSVAVIQYFYSRLGRNISQIKDYELSSSAKLLFMQNVFDVHKVKYFQERLPPVMWDKLLEGHSTDIFMAYFGSWNYRSRCAEVFNMSKKYYVNHDYMVLLHGIVDICLLNKYQYYDMRPIIEQVWVDTPACIKSEPEVYLTMIPQLVLIQNDFETLSLMLKSYDTIKQKEILTIVIFALITINESNLIDLCLKTLADVIIIEDYKTLLNLETFKDFLIFDAKTQDNRYKHLDLVAEIICDKAFNVNNLKKQLRDDKNLIVSILSLAPCKKEIYTFLRWLLKTELAVKKYQNKLFAKGWVQEAYHIRLMTFELSQADDLFSILKFSDIVEILIKQSVKQNPVALNFMLANCLETKQTDLNFFLYYLFVDKTEARQFIENFLNSDIGKTTITELFTRMQTLENDICLRYLSARKMITYSDFIDDWIRSTGLTDTMKACLREINDSVHTWPVSVDDCKILNEQDECEARQNALAQYTGFKILLQRKFTIYELDKWNRLSMIHICNKLVTEHNIPAELD